MNGTIEVTRKFPDCFPPNFEKMLPYGACEYEINVYRVCRLGIIDKKAFLSNYELYLQEEYELRDIKDLADVGIYSTSCYEKKGEINNFLKCIRKYHDRPIVAKGTTKSICGITQRTRERTGKKNSHVDWWLYKNSNPEKFFYKED